MKGGDEVKQLRLAMLVALFFGGLAGYGVYSFLKEARAEGMIDRPGVTCYTGRFPGLVPVTK